MGKADRLVICPASFYKGKTKNIQTSNEEKNTTKETISKESLVRGRTPMV